jgi:tripartite-type tricarboxylate transporter receptor subunit TctC
MDTKAVQDRMHELGTTLVSPDRRSPEYLQMLVEREVAKWGPLITAAGISVN